MVLEEPTYSVTQKDARGTSDCFSNRTTLNRLTFAIVFGPERKCLELHHRQRSPRILMPEMENPSHKTNHNQTRPRMEHFIFDRDLNRTDGGCMHGGRLCMYVL